MNCYIRRKSRHTSELVLIFDMRNKFELFSPPLTYMRESAHIYMRIFMAGIQTRELIWSHLASADICIDNNCGATRILRRLLMGEICFVPVSAGDLADFKFTGTVPYLALQAVARVYVRARASYIFRHQTAMSPRKCDASTSQYPSQLWPPKCRF